MVRINPEDRLNPVPPEESQHPQGLLPQPLKLASSRNRTRSRPVMATPDHIAPPGYPWDQRTAA